MSKSLQGEVGGLRERDIGWKQCFLTLELEAGRRQVGVRRRFRCRQESTDDGYAVEIEQGEDGD